MDPPNFLGAKRTRSGLNKAEDVDHNSFSEFKKENGEKNVDKDGLGTFGDSLGEKGANNEQFIEKESRCKFWFGEKDNKQAQKSEFEKILDTCWRELDKYLYDEESSKSDYIQRDVDINGHSKTHIDCVTLCSQGKHPDLYLDEQVGMICKSCSVVVQEIAYILPPFSEERSI